MRQKNKRSRKMAVETVKRFGIAMAPQSKASRDFLQKVRDGEETIYTSSRIGTQSRFQIPAHLTQ